MQIDFDRGVWIVTCKCGKWRLETSVGAGERVVDVFARVDTAYQQHVNEASEGTQD
jgi:hypothetical protein